MKKSLCYIGIITAILFFVSVGVLCAALGASQVSLLTGLEKTNEHTVILGDKTTSLNIFNSSTTEGVSFAPGSSGDGSFVLFNISGYPVQYKMSFTHENPMNIPIEYKIQEANGALIGGTEDTWTDVSLLPKVEGKLGIGEQAQYKIEWQWNDTLGDLDTSAFENTSDYTDYAFTIHVTSYPIGFINFFEPLTAHTDVLSIALALILTTVIGMTTYIIERKKLDKKPNDTPHN